MVAAEDVRVYLRVGNFVLKALRGDKIVDAPPGVLFPCLEAVRPP